MAKKIKITDKPLAALKILAILEKAYIDKHAPRMTKAERKYLLYRFFQVVRDYENKVGGLGPQERTN